MTLSPWCTGHQRHLMLLQLPADIQQLVFKQPGLGPRELASLEATSRAVRALIDEDVWRQAFLQSCRHNALGHPSSFKVEFKRRSTWSRRWKTLPDCAPGTVGASAPLPLQAAARLCSVRAPQKLRRFALKVIASLPQAHPPKAEVLVVDGSGREPGSFPTISAALRCAKPYDRVLIRSGRYEERLAIDKASAAPPPLPSPPRLPHVRLRPSSARRSPSSSSARTPPAASSSSE